MGPKAQHKKTANILTSRLIELLHMDLTGLIQTENIGEKKYIMIIIDDYSRYTWAIILKDKFKFFDLVGNCSENYKHKKFFLSLEFVVIIRKNLKILIFYFFYNKQGIH